MKPETATAPAPAKIEDSAAANISRALAGPPQAPPAAPAAKSDEQKKSTGDGEENKGALEQIQHDLDSVGKLLNPFRW